MKPKARNPIAQNIKKYRILNDMTQEQLAGLLDLDTQYYSQLERGERNFTIDKLIKLCSIFHIGIEDIIEVEPAQKEDNSELAAKLTSHIQLLSQSQLFILEKFISEILPYIK